MTNLYHLDISDNDFETQFHLVINLRGYLILLTELLLSPLYFYIIISIFDQIYFSLYPELKILKNTALISNFIYPLILGITVVSLYLLRRIDILNKSGGFSRLVISDKNIQIEYDGHLKSLIGVESIQIIHYCVENTPYNIERILFKGTKEEINLPAFNSDNLNYYVWKQLCEKNKQILENNLKNIHKTGLSNIVGNERIDIKDTNNNIVIQWSTTWLQYIKDLSWFLLVIMGLFLITFPFAPPSGSQSQIIAGQMYQVLSLITFMIWTYYHYWFIYKKSTANKYEIRITHNGEWDFEFPYLIQKKVKPTKFGTHLVEGTDENYRFLTIISETKGEIVVPYPIANKQLTELQLLLQSKLIS